MRALALSKRFLAAVVTVFGLVALGGCPVDDPAGEGEGEGEGNEGEGEAGEGEGEGEGEVNLPSARFVAVGYGGRRLTSADGIAWEHDVADVENGGDDDNLLRGVCAGRVGGQSVVLAVGGSAQGRVLRSVDGGVTWETSSIDDDGWIGACTFLEVEGAPVVLFVGSARSARSLDGGRTLVDKTTRFFPGGGWGMRDVEVVDVIDNAGGDVAVAVGDLGVSTTVDGITWSEPSGPQRLFRVAAGKGRAVAIGFSVRATSADLVSWQETAGNNLGDVIFADDTFLVVGDGFRQTSSNGVDFTTTNQPAMSRVAAGVVNGSRVYVGANFPDQRRHSVDGVTWESGARDDRNAIDDLLFLAGP